MGGYSGPPRNRPETTFSGYASGLRSIAGFCAFFALIFLSVGIKEFIHPGKMEAAQRYATLGVGCALALIAVVCVRALQMEWKSISPLYVEFRDKQLRNIAVDEEIYFLAGDIVDSVCLEGTDREEALSKLKVQRGGRLLDNKLFVNTGAIEAVFSKRDDRGSILLMRLIRQLRCTKREPC